MITVFGLGFVGLTTAVGFAHFGYKVYGLDINPDRKKLLRNGHIPFLETGLDSAFKEELNHNFFLTDDVAAAVSDSNIIYYCVGTPYGNNGQADLTYLFSAIDSTLPHIDTEKQVVLVIKSTIPPSTTAEKIIPYIESQGYDIGKNILIAHNPEFLREGHCWEDFIHADRIVIGTDHDAAFDVLSNLYSPFHIPIFKVSANTGEFIKYLSNTLLATMISYSNEMAEIATVIGNIDIAKAFHILHLDKRWNNCNMATYVYPGCGYGGYCLPKDTSALFSIAQTKGFTPHILQEVIKTNSNMPLNIARRISNKCTHSDTLGILGLAFKPFSNDVRDSASGKIISELLQMGFHNIIAYDPVANEEFENTYKLAGSYTHLTLPTICSV